MMLMMGMDKNYSEFLWNKKAKAADERELLKSNGCSIQVVVKKSGQENVEIYTDSKAKIADNANFPLHRLRSDFFVAQVRQEILRPVLKVTRRTLYRA